MNQFDKQFNKLIERVHVSTSLNYKKNIPIKKEPVKNKKKGLPNTSKE